MQVTIKTPAEQAKMRTAGRLAAEVLDMIAEHVVPGVTTEELDRLCHDYIVNVQRSVPANLNYRGFPKTICSSVNHVVGHGIPSFVEGNDYSVVREYCGHGIGRVYHEDPQVLHYGEPGTGLKLEPGMTFTIEPMVNAGKRHVRLLPDGWTVVTKDHSLSAQWEHTVLVTDTGFDVLTLPANGAQP